MEWVKLTDICRPKQWKTIAGRDLLADGYPVYGANGLIGYWAEYNHEYETITIACRGTCGKVNIVPGQSYINGNAMCLDDLSDRFGLKFLYYYLKGYDFKDVITGTTIPQITIEGLQKVKVPCLPLVEQEEIVLSLTRVDTIIQLRQQQLVSLDDLIKARFVEMFATEENRMPLSELCSIITDGTHQPPKFKSEGIPFIFVSNITEDKVTYNAEKFIDQDTYDELIKRTPIEIGDVLLSTVGSYGHPAVVKSDKKFLFQRHIAFLKPKREMIDSDYLHGAILSPAAQEQIEKGVKGIAQKTLNLSVIKKMTIPVPPMENQKQFATFKEQVDKSKVVVQKSLDEAQLLFDSLMQKYFG